MVVFTLIASICRIVEQYTAGAMFDGLDQIYGEIGVVLEAFPVRFDIAVVVWVHNLARGDPCHEAAERRFARAAAIDVVDFIRIWDKFSLIETFAILIHGHIFELGHVEAFAKEVELVTADGVVVFLSGSIDV